MEQKCSLFIFFSFLLRMKLFLFFLMRMSGYFFVTKEKKGGILGLQHTKKQSEPKINQCCKLRETRLPEYNQPPS